MSRGVDWLLEVAVRAISVHNFELESLKAKRNLKQHYQEYREEYGDAIERYSDAYDQMLEATRDSYLAVKRAKTAHYNAKRRLASWIRRAA